MRRPGVLREHLEGPLVQVGGKLGEQLGREVHLELVPLVGLHPAVAGPRLGVGEGQVGLDVVDGRAVHHVGPHHEELGAARAVVVGGVGLHAGEPHAGECKVVGAKARPRGEHAHAPRAAQAGRAHGGRPLAAAVVLREVPDEPHVVERLQAAHRVGVAELRLELHHALQRVHQARLAGHAELHGVGRADAGDGADEVGLRGLVFLHEAVAPGWRAGRGGSCGCTARAGVCRARVFDRVPACVRERHCSGCVGVRCPSAHKSRACTQSGAGPHRMKDLHSV